MQLEFLLASTPAVLVGIWYHGAQLALRLAADGGRPLSGWFGEFGLGLAVFSPRLIACLAASAAWALLFARFRNRPVDPGWLLTGWLYAALLPGALPLAAAVAGISFGMTVGSQIFGGTGRYPVSPVLLGVLFLVLAYPDRFGAGGVLPGFDDAPTWSLLAGGGSAAAVEAGWSWLDLALGRELGAVGAVSDLACLVGVVWLVVRGWASLRTLLAGCVGVGLGSLLVSGGDAAGPALAWHWHLVSGSFVFVLAFVATDPSTQALTRAGRWLSGVLAGVLLVVLRTANPAHPEGSLYAFVLAGLCTPLLDHLVLTLRTRAAGKAKGQ